MSHARSVAMLVAAVLVSAASIAGPVTARSDPSKPRWVRHVERYPGGISNGVRASISPEVIAARARALTATGSGGPVGGVNVQMNTDSEPPMPQNETAVAYSLRDPMVAVAAANDYVSLGVVVMRTSDGGRHWRSTRITPAFGGTGDACSGGDPSVAYSRRDSAFYLTQLCFFRAASPSEVHLYGSVDDGKTWTPSFLAAVVATNFDYQTGVVDEAIFHDKEYLAVDNHRGSPHFGRVYVTWTKFHLLPSGFSDYCNVNLAYTDDIPLVPADTGFQHVAVQPEDPGGNGHGKSADQFSVPVVEKDGTLDVAFATSECNASFEHHFWLQKSTDGGATFLPDAIRVDPPHQFVDNTDPNDLLPNKKFRAPNTLSLAYSEATGTLAYVYTNYRNRAASGADVVGQRSTDGGQTWSPIRNISKRMAFSERAAKHDQFFPWAAFTPSGTLYVIWLDCRRDPANKRIDTFQARSVDDGQTFSNERINAKSWNPDHGFFTSGSFIGDYSGLAASDQAVYAVWTDGSATDFGRTQIGETDVFTQVRLTP